MGYVSDLRKKVGHAPVVIAFSVMVLRGKDGRFLLEERADDGFWDFPGGSIEFNEKAEDAAKRELFEETHLQARSSVLLGVYSGPLTYYRYANGDVVSGVDTVYLCEDYEGEIAPQVEEVKRLAWFDLASFPEKMSPRNQQIALDLKKKFSKE
jgi:8-oxo-dGTP pyrophosphatase MutT (NUDIX family)